jgi:hypothetical protein
VTEEIMEEMKKFLESKENEIKACQNLWDTANAMLRGKLIGISTYNKKQISNLMLHIKLLEKQEQTKLITSRWREIMKIRAEINEMETKKELYKE